MSEDRYQDLDDAFRKACSKTEVRPHTRRDATGWYAEAEGYVDGRTVVEIADNPEEAGIVVQYPTDIGGELPTDTFNRDAPGTTVAEKEAWFRKVLRKAPRN